MKISWLPTTVFLKKQTSFVRHQNFLSVLESWCPNLHVLSENHTNFSILGCCICSIMAISRVVEHARLRKPRNQPNVASDSSKNQPHSAIHGPKFAHLQPPSRLSKSNSSSEPRESLISIKPRKMFFLGLGCKGASMPATAPKIIRSAADWETENERRKRQGSRKVQNRARNPDNVDICCAPPGISFSCDVVPSTSPRHVQVDHLTKIYHSQEPT